MAEAFIFENWQHVFEPSLHINETWDRWKKQFFKEVKSFIGHEIKNDGHEKTTLKSAKWFNKDICRLIRAKNRLYRRATTSGKSYHWEVYCAARNKATYAVRVAKAKFYNQKAETLANPNCPPSKWWQLHPKNSVIWMEEIQQLFPHFVLVLRTLWKMIKKRPISWIILLSTKTLASTSKVFQLVQHNWNLCSPSRIFAQLMSEKSSSLYQTKLLLVLMRFRIAFLKKLVLEW